jgi:hypothetical protein
MVSIRRLSIADTIGSHVALVLPGAGYTAQAPLLYWTSYALTNAGWDVWGIDWHADIDEAVRRDMQGFVESALAQAESVLPGTAELVIAKSFGTFGLPYLVDREVRAAWLTPILTDPIVAEALASVSGGEHLGIGGTADPSWRPDLVGSTRARLVTVPDADHSLEVASTDWRVTATGQLRIIDQLVAHLIEP